MTPKHLYIPTCSQNFNNIMSSESISPAGFYERRNFGMKRFLRVEANNLNDRIALYKDIPKFNILSTDEDNFPIYIRIDTSCYDEELFYESDLDGIYYCNQTIYITPYSCSFFLFSEADFRIVYSAQQRSLNTKMTRLYAKAFYPIKDPLVVREYDYTHLKNSEKDISEYIAKDRRINKLKGFYLAYLIGLMKEMSPSIVRLYHLTNQLSDALDSALTNTRNSIIQESQIENIYNHLNKIFRELSNENQLIEEAIAKDSQQYRIEGDLLTYIKSHGWYNDWKYQKHIPETYQVTPLLIHSDSEVKERHINNIVKYIDELRGQKYPSIEELPTIMLGTLTAIPEAEFLEFVYRETMKEIFNSSDFINDRYSFSIDVCKQYKSFVGEENFAIVRDYLNSLNKNLKSYMEFDINSYEDEDFRAYAAFCQKGDPNDFGKLEDYLINSEIGSLHKSFAIAGMVFGYADMPKTFTECFTHNLDHAFIKTHYRHLTQCVGINISHIPVDSIEIKDKDLTVPTNPKLREEVHTVIAPLKPSDRTMKKIDDALEVEGRQFNPQAFLQILNNLIRPSTKVYQKLEEELVVNQHKYNSVTEFRNEIRRIYHTLPPRSRQERYWSDIELAIELEAKVGDYMAFMSILDDHLSPSTKEYKQLKKHFGGGVIRTSKANKVLELSLFSEQFSKGQQERLFSTSSLTIDVLRKYLEPNQLEKIMWFFEDIRKVRSERTYYKKVDETNNKMAIDTFCKSQQIVQYLGVSKVDELRKVFYQLYGIR